MSKKNLLNEGTVRRFMKLAEIEPLTGQFVKKLNEGDYKDEEKLEEEADMMADMTDDDGMDGMIDEDYDLLGEEEDGDSDTAELEAALGELLEADYQDDEDMPEGDEMDMEMDMEDPEGDEMGMEMDMEGPAPAAGLDPEEIKEMVKDAVMDALKQLVDDGELDISMDSTEEVDVEEPSDDEPEDEDDEEMVNEVARRVMKRILNSRRR